MGAVRFHSMRGLVKKPNPLAEIFHPHWSSSEDHALLVARKKKKNFTEIAREMGRSRIAVEQRWHRLRVISNVIDLLEAYGLSSRPYPMCGGGDE